MDYKFEDCVSGIIETATKVEVEKAFIDRITAFVSALTEKKQTKSITLWITGKKQKDLPLAF